MRKKKIWGKKIVFTSYFLSLVLSNLGQKDKTKQNKKHPHSLESIDQLHWNGYKFYHRGGRAGNFEPSKLGSKAGLGWISNDGRHLTQAEKPTVKKREENSDVGRGAEWGGCSERCQTAFSCFNFCFNLVLHTEKEREILYPLFCDLSPQGSIFPEQ